MFTQIDVNNWILATGDNRLAPYGTYLFQVAQVYDLHCPDNELAFEMGIQDTINQLHVTVGHIAPAMVRNLVKENMDSWSDGTPGGFAGIALPVVAAPVLGVPPAPRINRFVAEKARLARWRTKRTTARGKELATQARALQDWFHWVSSGPVPVVIPLQHLARIPQANEPFKPKQTWSVKETDVGWETHELKHNDFARWMNEGFGIPDQNAWMNCWECVFFTAFRAGLITSHRLGVVHDMATCVARGKHAQQVPTAGSNYYTVLNHALGFRESVPMALKDGLIPREGDILFFDGNTHVAISLGRTWRSGVAEDRMMSLWHHNGGRNDALTLEDMPAWMRGDVRFAPCPF